MIDVTQLTRADPLEFQVTVREGNSRTDHRVTLSRKQYEILAGGACPEDQFVEAVFRFLLDREPKEAILGRFDVSVISRYFPEFEERLPDYLEPGRQGP